MGEGSIVGGSSKPGQAAFQTPEGSLGFPAHRLTTSLPRGRLARLPRRITRQNVHM
jgi:hypothetical protein